jgi:hypothetical protein
MGSQATGDDSVLSIVYTSADGHVWIHRTVPLVGPPDIQARSAIAVLKEHHCSHVLIETNGVGAMLPDVFRSVAGGSGVSCTGFRTTQNKQEKILTAYDVRLAGGKVHAHESVMATKFRTQLRDFSMRSRGKDDFIDSVAMAILGQPSRVRAQQIGIRSGWKTSNGPIECGFDSVVL